MKKSQEPFGHFNMMINYSSCNEDTNSELRALEISEDDVVLAVTGGGARALDLLTARPKKIIAIDMNPLQNYLLELKMAAIKALNYDRYAEFLGLRGCNERVALYRRICSELSHEARLFWDTQLKMIKKGVLYQGRWERYFKILAWTVKIFRRKKVKTLFSFADIEKQREFCRAKWNSKLWKSYINFVCRRFFWKYFLRDPGFYHYVPRDFHIGDYIFSSMMKSLDTYLARDNHFFSLLFHSKYTNEKSLPIYLQERNYAVLRENLSRIEIVTDSLQHYLRYCPEQSIDKFSLSDVSSFMAENDYLLILKSCLRVTKPKGLFCLRHFLVKRGIPEILRKDIQLFSSLEQELNQTDISFGYTFTVGQFLLGEPS